MSHEISSEDELNSVQQATLSVLSEMYGQDFAPYRVLEQWKHDAGTHTLKTILEASGVTLYSPNDAFTVTAVAWIAMVQMRNRIKEGADPDDALQDIMGKLISVNPEDTVSTAQ